MPLSAITFGDGTITRCVRTIAANQRALSAAP
jgi:hypothetical protein